MIDVRIKSNLILIFNCFSFIVDDYTTENPLDFTAGSIRPNEHAFFSDVTTMKELENDLTDLLQRFREGTLLAFSKSSFFFYFLLNFQFNRSSICLHKDGYNPRNARTISKITFFFR
jgi:hypothetical protein